MLKVFAKTVVNVYQYSIGLVIAPSCRFLPTCSEYALIAINDHGAARGSYLAFKRICRCHPFHSGGIDEVPPKNNYGV
jgi:uncharacterized protein